jgi:hypothetical protein
MKRLYGCLAVASLLLWTDHIAGAQEDPYGLVPELIPDDVDAAMAEIGGFLKETLGVKVLNSVVVVGLTEKGVEYQVSFANGALRQAKLQAQDCFVPVGKSCDPRVPLPASAVLPACQRELPALLAPKCDPATGELIGWFGDFNDPNPPPPPPKSYSLDYKGSPGTHLDCGNNQGGTRPCR